MEREIVKLKEIWMEVFGDSRRFTEFYFDRVAPTAKLFTLKRGGEVASMLFSIPRTLSLCGEEIKARYLSGVATVPKYRHLGLMTENLNTAVKDAKDDGAVFIYLTAVDEKIYEKAGFKKFGMQRFLRSPETKLFMIRDARYEELLRLEKIAEGDDAPLPLMGMALSEAAEKIFTLREEEIFLPEIY